MSPHGERIYRTLLHLLPREARQRGGDDMLAAFTACVAREQARHGARGAAFAWVRGAADVALAAVTLRADRRRARRVAGLGRQSSSPGDDLMTRVWQDLTHATRRMRQAPMFSLAVVVTLALATGATTAIFSVVDAVLLRALPYPEPDRLVMLYLGFPKMAPIGFSPADYNAFPERVSSFESMAAFRNVEYELSGVDQPERITAARVSAALFRTLGVAAAHGRAFTQQEDEGWQPVAVLSHTLWRTKFGADPSAVGKTILLDRRPYTIVGVMPETFTFPSRGWSLNPVPAAVFVPTSFSDRERVAYGSNYNNSVVARLKPGVTVSQAEREVRTVIRSAAVERYPPSLRGLGEVLTASATPLRDETVGRARTLLSLLFAAIVVVLLIACADLANLLLTRAVSRQREMAVRAALGAGRGRLIRQSLVEAAVLAVAGAALGLVVARWVMAALIAAAPATLPRMHEVRIDLRVLGFTALLAIATALLCGLLPAWEATRQTSADALKEGGRSGGMGQRQRRVFGILVTAQFALAVVLLVAGGLLLRSFNKLVHVDPGFRAESALTLATSLPSSAYPTGPDIRSFYTRLLDRISALPGVTAAGASTDLPLDVRERRAFTIEAEGQATRDLPYSVAHVWVAGSSFEALGIPLKAGRFLGPEDTQSSEPVVVVNETMRRTFWPGADPVGQRVAFGNPARHGAWMRIVGVVADVKQGPLSSQVVAQMFQPWVQVSDPMLGGDFGGALRSMKISVRAQGDPMALAAAVREQVRGIDPSLPVSAVQTLQAVVDASVAPERFNAILLGSFAALALLLAALGVGGVLATSVSRRTQELGLRMALGAQRAMLLRMVLKEGMLLVAVGLALGLPAALALTRLMSALLFEVSPRDPVTFAGVVAVLSAVALIACYVPARRATTVDPMTALRRE